MAVRLPVARGVLCRSCTWPCAQSLHCACNTCNVSYKTPTFSWLQAIPAVQLHARLACPGAELRIQGAAEGHLKPCMTTCCNSISMTMERSDGVQPSAMQVGLLIRVYVVVCFNMYNPTAYHHQVTSVPWQSAAPHLPRHHAISDTARFSGCTCLLPSVKVPGLMHKYVCRSQSRT